MKYQLIGIAIICAAFLLPAEDMELVQFSDLRLRNAAEGVESLYGTWKLKDGQSGETLDIQPKRISGSDGCNRFSASLMVAESSLKVGPIMSTRAICPDLNGSDEKYRITLARASKYQINETGELQLLDGEGKVLLTFLP